MAEEIKGSAAHTKRELALLRQIEGGCQHFNGAQHDCCSAGVNYADIGGALDGRALRLPCLSPETFEKRRKELGYQLADCPQLRRVTREEAEKEVEEIIGRGDRTMKAMTKAHEHAKQNGLRKGNGGRGEMPCPICETGTLRYSVAGYNGHMHAQCNTEGCVSWME